MWFVKFVSAVFLTQDNKFFRKMKFKFYLIPSQTHRKFINSKFKENRLMR